MSLPTGIPHGFICGLFKYAPNIKEEGFFVSVIICELVHFSSFSIGGKCFSTLESVLVVSGF